jgi:catechol 2,3-dioxygenase-like lactoylglutathione lyase family enzyme
MIVGIDHVQIAAPPGCESAARRFYGEILGMPEIPKPAELAKRGGAWFQCGAQQLHVGVEPDFRAARKAHPAIAVRDASALETALTSAGIETICDNAIPGVRRFYAADPFGNRLEFVEVG